MEQIDCESMQIILYHLLGLTCRHLGVHDKTLQHYQTSLLKLLLLNLHHEEIGDTYNHMGVMCSSLRKHHQGMEYYCEALRIDKLMLGGGNNSRTDRIPRFCTLRIRCSFWKLVVPVCRSSAVIPLGIIKIVLIF